MPKTFMYDYEFHGARWAFDIEAESKAEAEARLQQIAHAKYTGEVAVTVPVDLPRMLDYAKGYAVGVLTMLAVHMIWG